MVDLGEKFIFNVVNKMNGNGNYELLIIVMGIVVGSILGWDFV